MTESIILSAIAVAGTGLAALGVLVYRRLNVYRRALRMKAAGHVVAGQQAGLGEESPLARYQPMLRLLAGDDADFLRRNPHCPKVERLWKRSQRRIVRLYLKEMATDFHRLHGRARALVAQAPEQYSHLVPLLFKQQLVFWRALLWIEMRLSLGGASVPKVNAIALVGAFESLRGELSRAAAPAQDQLA